MRNAWHFYHALILVIKVACGSTVLRCSPLKRALVANEENAAKAECLGLMSMCFWLGFSHFNF
ncbi:DUF3265 domain-containing protein [Vibrio parahaemolyticus]|nr:DUF3265 domain-containing protein [Vibrio parahaemolyticus]EGR2216490.1 DUF3265 domain-containing protein [Vibrio parahaemolyticus]EGR2784249.1 DUF3265 domain-containing protein [Vibrio parahaemolyticus]